MCHRDVPSLFVFLSSDSDAEKAVQQGLFYEAMEGDGRYPPQDGESPWHMRIKEKCDGHYRLNLNDTIVLLVASVKTWSKTRKGIFLFKEQT